MSESEDLKKNADISRATQQVDALRKYLQFLNARISETRSRQKSSFKIWALAWLAWVVGGAFNPGMNYVLLIMFMLTWFYDSFRLTQLMKAYAEYRGAIRVLEILGHLKVDEDQGDRKKRKIFEEGVSMVKRWFSEKKAVQEKAYAPA